jgi:hypothetical protein
VRGACGRKMGRRRVGPLRHGVCCSVPSQCVAMPVRGQHSPAPVHRLQWTVHSPSAATVATADAQSPPDAVRLTRRSSRYQISQSRARAELAAQTPTPCAPVTRTPQAPQAHREVVSACRSSLQPTHDATQSTRSNRTHPIPGTLHASLVSHSTHCIPSHPTSPSHLLHCVPVYSFSFSSLFPASISTSSDLQNANLARFFASGRSSSP